MTSRFRYDPQCFAAAVRLKGRAAIKADVDAGVQDFKDGRVSQIDVNALKIRARSAKRFPDAQG